MARLEVCCTVYSRPVCCFRSSYVRTYAEAVFCHCVVVVGRISTTTHIITYKTKNWTTNDDDCRSRRTTRPFSFRTLIAPWSANMSDNGFHLSSLNLSDNPIYVYDVTAYLYIGKCSSRWRPTLLLRSFYRWSSGTLFIFAYHSLFLRLQYCLLLVTTHLLLITMMSAVINQCYLITCYFLAAFFTSTFFFFYLNVSSFSITGAWPKSKRRVILQVNKQPYIAERETVSFYVMFYWKVGKKR